MTLVLATSLLSSVLIGYLITRIFLPIYRPSWADLTLKISLGAGVGAGVTSCQFFLARLIVGPSRIGVVVMELLLLAAAGLGFWFMRETLRLDRPNAQPAGWLWALLPVFLGSLAMAVALFADGSASNPHGAWDAWSIWNLRAKFLAQSDTTWRRAFSPILNHIAGGGARHPEYPMLLSGYVARCWALMGSLSEVAAPIATAALFSGGTLALLVSALAVLRGWSTAMLGGIILLGSAGFLTDGPWQYADVPLAFFYLAAFALLFLADAETQSRGRIMVLAGLVMGLAAWTKDEGLLFTLILSLAVVGYAVMTENGGRGRTLGAFASGAAAPLAIVLGFRFILAPPIATPVTIAEASHQIFEGHRYLQIAKALWNEAVAMGSGIANPAVAVLVLGACLGIPANRRRQPVVVVSSIAFLILFAAYIFAYVITPMDLTWHLSTSLGRLYVQLWPSFVFLALAAFRPAEEILAKAPAAPVAARKTKKGKSLASR